MLWLMLLAICISLLWQVIVTRTFLAIQRQYGLFFEAPEWFWPAIGWPMAWVPSWIAEDHMGLAFAEETVWRAIPLWGAVHLLSNQGAVMAVALVSSALFGIGHAQDVGFNLMQQGMFGLLMSVVYLKAGGWSGRLLVPLLVAGLVHTISNALNQPLWDLLGNTLGIDLFS